MGELCLSPRSSHLPAIHLGDGGWRACRDVELGAISDVLLLHDPAYWAIFVEFRFYFLLPIVVIVFAIAGHLHWSIPPALMVGAIVAHIIMFPAGTTVPGYRPEGGHASLIATEYIVIFVAGAFAAWLTVETRDKVAHLRTARWLDRTLIFTLAAPWLMSPVLVKHVYRRLPASVRPT